MNSNKDPAPLSLLAVAALVLSMVFSPAGLVAGLVALRRINAAHGMLRGKALAVIAIVLSAAGIFAGVLMAVLVFLGMSKWV
ncbi:MAG: hypothetical protein QM765_34635 [Myxococcales bacterium]